MSKPILIIRSKEKEDGSYVNGVVGTAQNQNKADFIIGKVAAKLIVTDTYTDKNSVVKHGVTPEGQNQMIWSAKADELGF